jgi:histidyl-tRNA synthetase
MSRGNERIRFQAPRGTSDVLPEDEPYWRFVRNTAERLARLFGYGYIETPMFEDARIWLRTNEGTEVVEKELYLFEDRGGEQLALRPETTASVCRAYIEHGMSNRPQPTRLFYFAQKFRYDRPQAGRFRQHTEFGVEVIGEADAIIDAEVVQLLSELYGALGLRGLSLQFNSIGDAECRPQFIDLLRDAYRGRLDEVCDDCRMRFEKNPMRLFDCKQERCQPVIASAPTITERLCVPCASHFDEVRAHLNALGVAFQVNPRLVRGLDYYTRSVFEFMPPEEGAQSVVGAGGRYDGLIELLGGRPTPGVGFGSGIERIILNLKRQEVDVPAADDPVVYVAHMSEEGKKAALRLAARLRSGGVAAVVGTGGRSLKAQLRHADALGARFTAILGDQELANGQVTLRDMAGGDQRAVADDELASAVAR